MKKILLASVAVLLAAPALAADLPARSMAPAPMYAPVFTWTGFYVGAQVGYAWGESSIINRLGFGAGAINAQTAIKKDGIFGGIHAGYNYQFNSIVVGIEADVNAHDMRSGLQIANNAAGAPIPPNAHSVQLNWSGSVRARLGFAFDRFLPYITGGVAFGDAKFTLAHAAATGVLNETMVGWTAGAGLEYAITNNWSARLEYRYTDYGKASAAVFAPGFPAELATAKLKTNDVRFGISYKFGGPAGPVVAKY